MDYTRLGLEKKEDLFESSTEEIERRVGVLLLRAVLVALICFVVISVCGVLGIVNGILANAPSVAEINIAPSGYATFIYDTDGNQLQKLTTSNSNRISVSIDKVPTCLQNAVVAIEDARFYQHDGIDPKGIVRAAFVAVKYRFRRTEGASTITQQLLKNNVFINWTQEEGFASVRRKIQEQYLAIELEERLESELGSKAAAKQRILENYLNTINLGAGCYGVQAASRKYFNKDVSELTVSEAAVIAGITQNPSNYNPIRHPENNAEKRDIVLEYMKNQGYISQEQFDEAHADDEDVYLRIQAAQEIESSEATVYSYFIDELTKQVVSDLEAQKGFTEVQAYQALYSGGLRIYTTQDMDIQTIMDEEYANPENFPNEAEYSMDWALSVLNSEGETINYSREMLQKYFREQGETDFDLLFDTPEEGQAYIDKYKEAVVGDDEIIAERTSFAPEPQSSMVIIEQSTGYVKGIIGGRGEKTASLTLNRATNTTQQPGSTFKVVGTYAAAIDQAGKTLGTIYTDEPTTYSNGRPVSNSTQNYYQGNVTLRYAIEQSINTVAVKCITEITPQVAYNQLLKFGFTTLDPRNDVYQPLALGGIYNGVTNLELTAAYAAIANEGEYIKPVFYTKILDQDGNIVIDNTKESSRAVEKSTAAVLTYALQDVVKSGTAQDVQLPCGMPVAGKTGTTSSYNDVWFVGFTPYYTCGVWAGYDTSENLPDEGIYRLYHRILWRSVMDRISANQPIVQFTLPSDVKMATICTDTGLLATSRCYNTEVLPFALGTAPSSQCTEHGSRTSYDNYEAERAAERQAVAEAATEAAHGGGQTESDQEEENTDNSEEDWSEEEWSEENNGEEDWSEEEWSEEEWSDEEG